MVRSKNCVLLSEQQRNCQVNNTFFLVAEENHHQALNDNYKNNWKHYNVSLGLIHSFLTLSCKKSTDATLPVYSALLIHVLLMNSFLCLWINFSFKVPSNTTQQAMRVQHSVVLLSATWKAPGLIGWAAWRKMLPNSWQVCSSYGGEGFQKCEKTESWLWSTQHMGL